jgi:hypothetical protein
MPKLRGASRKSKSRSKSKASKKSKNSLNNSQNMRGSMENSKLILNQDSSERDRQARQNRETIKSIKLSQTGPLNKKASGFMQDMTRAAADMSADGGKLHSENLDKQSESLSQSYNASLIEINKPMVNQNRSNLGLVTENPLAESPSKLPSSDEKPKGLAASRALGDLH